MHILNHILTGTMSSRIFGTARKRGLAYGMFSGASAGFYNSAWDFGGQVNLETAEALFDVIVRELRRVLDGNLSAEDIESAKSYALGRYQSVLFRRIYQRLCWRTDSNFDSDR